MPPRWLLLLAAMMALGAVFSGQGAAAAAPQGSSQGTSIEQMANSDLAAQRRARIYVTPGRRGGTGPNSVRQCRSWLTQEYRVSGTVIVPRMQCWWE